MRTIIIANLIKDLFVLTGMSYLYFYKGVSGWWWILAIIILLSNYSYKRKAKKDEA